MRKPGFRKMMPLLLIPFVLTACGEKTAEKNTVEEEDMVSEADMKEIAGGLYSRDFEYEIQFSGGSSGSLTEGKVSASPYVQYEIPSERGAGGIERYWIGSDSGVKSVFRTLMDDTNATDWVVAEHSSRGLDDYVRDDLDYTFDRSEDGCSVFTSGYERKIEYPKSIVTGNSDDADEMITFTGKNELEFYVDPDTEQITKIRFSSPDNAKADAVISAMQSGMTREEAEESVKDTDTDGYPVMVVTFRYPDEGVDIAIPDEVKNLL